jgi:hypothetical protein
MTPTQALAVLDQVLARGSGGLLAADRKQLAVAYDIVAAAVVVAERTSTAKDSDASTLPAPEPTR